MSTPNGSTHELLEKIWNRPNPQIEAGKQYTCYMYEPITGGVRFHQEHCSPAEVEQLHGTASRWGYMFRIYTEPSNEVRL